MSTGDKTIRRIPAALRYCDMASLTFLLKRMGLDQTRIWRRRARKELTARLVIRLCIKCLWVRLRARLLIGWFTSPKGGKIDVSGGVEMAWLTPLAGVR